MVENPSAGLVMLSGEVAVTVTREEHHQAALARYAVPAGAERHVAVELAWCRIATGKYKGQRAIEVRLDGKRVGELTFLMSDRYAALVEQVRTGGGRPGCEAVITRDAKGLQLTVRLPRDTDGVVGLPVAAPTTRFPAVATPPPVAAAKQGGFLAAHKPFWIAAAVIFVVFVVALAGNSGDDEPSTPLADTSTTTTTIEPLPTTTTTTTTTITTTPPPPPPIVEVPVVTPEPAPAPPPVVVPEPVREPEPAPPGCDPNYTGCVPIAPDVDCAGGSGNGPAYVEGPVQVVGSDIYGLDRDGDGTACDS